jgi:hypothetical protein
VDASFKSNLICGVAEDMVKTDVWGCLHELMEIMVGDKAHMNILDYERIMFRCLCLHCYGHVVENYSYPFLKNVWKKEEVFMVYGGDKPHAKYSQLFMSPIIEPLLGTILSSDEIVFLQVRDVEGGRLVNVVMLNGSPIAPIKAIDCLKEVEVHTGSRVIFSIVKCGAPNGPTIQISLKLHGPKNLFHT